MILYIILYKRIFADKIQNKGVMLMRNKLFKTSKILSFIFIFGMFCIAVCEARWEVTELPTGNGLKITDVKPGTLHDELRAVPYAPDYTNLLVTGEMNDRDFRNLSLSTYTHKYKSIDLSGVSADSMPEDSFFERNSLEKFVCPANLKIIKKRSFMNCSNLEIVVFPKSLKKIENCCFQFCRKLKTPPPDGVELGTRAFHATLNDPNNK